mgnify:CR=1 FL=1
MLFRSKMRYYKNVVFVIRRLVDANYTPRSSFLTLTQDPKREGFFGSDVKEGMHQLNLFMKRLRYYLKKQHPRFELKYLSTWELQKNQNVHFHIILFDFPFVPIETMAKLWGHGGIDLHRIDKCGINEVGLYVAKYFSKDVDLKGKGYKQKAYTCSRNLKSPVVKKIYCPDFDIKDYGTPNYHSQYSIPKEKTGKAQDIRVDYYNIPKI